MTYFIATLFLISSPSRGRARVGLNSHVAKPRLNKSKQLPPIPTFPLKVGRGIEVD
jgi:hypothetical protein